jgi:hypothetical protein
VRARVTGGVAFAAAVYYLAVDQQLYANHVYLLSVLVLLFVLADAGVAASIDAERRWCRPLVARPVFLLDDDPARFGNHSCDPTTWLVDEVALVARRALAPGEKLTSDYATLTARDWAMPCRCGAPACRGTVTGRDLERPELQARYAGHVVPFHEGR